jgi:predicted nuclease of predicted toxin-antitoxin system
MKILCDVHIAIKVTKYFQSKGIETVHVNEILDSWLTKDNEICVYADKNGYTVLTKDKDFKDSHFINKTPKKLLRVNLGNISTNKLIAILESTFDHLNDLFDVNQKCYVELSDSEMIILKDD